MLDLGTLRMKIALQDDEAVKGLREFGNLSDETESKLKKGLGTAGKAAAAGFAAAAAAAVAMGKAALDSYADYEQLAGGVETLFGDSADTIFKYAQNAYQTAGLSANEYMETVTSFSASLLQSLGGDTEAAAKQADRAITDMADNANKMGTAMESIQNAYQGFAKQNYTMLDNLKLGYGGTKAEMERLIEDANKLRKAQGLNADLTIDSYSDIVDAIHTVEVEMGIAGITMEEYYEIVRSGAMSAEEAQKLLGTTAKEALTTIQGSGTAFKAAWGNLLTGLADENQNVGELFQMLSDTFNTYAGLVSKRVFQIVENMVAVFPQIIQTINENIPLLLEPILNGLVMIISQLMEQLPLLLDGVIQIMVSVANTISTNMPTIIQSVIAGILGVVQTLIDNIPIFLQAILNITIAVVNGIVQSIPAIVETIPQIVENLVLAITGMIPVLVDAFITLFLAVIDHLPEIIDAIVGMIPQIIISVVKAIMESIPQIVNAGVRLFVSLIENAPQIIATIVSIIPRILVDLVKGFINGIPQMIDAGWQLLMGLKDGIINGVKNIVMAIPNMLGNIVDGVKSFFGIKSPSKLFAEIGDYCMEGLGQGIEKNVKYAVNAAKDASAKVISAFDIQAPEYTVGYRATSNANSGNVVNQYSIGDIHITASDIKDVNSIENFIDMIQRTKNLYPVGGVAYGI